MSDRKLERLCELTNFAVYVSMNEHRSFAGSVRKYLDSRGAPEFPKDVIREMKKRNTVVEVRWFPEPDAAGFCYVVWGYDLDDTLADAVLRAERYLAMPGPAREEEGEGKTRHLRPV